MAKPGTRRERDRPHSRHTANPGPTLDAAPPARVS